MTDHPATVATTAACQVAYVVSTNYEYSYVLNNNPVVIGNTSMTTPAAPYTVVPAGTVPAAASTT